MFTTLFKAHRAVMVVFSFPLNFSDSGFHFHDRTHVQGYRCPEGRNLSILRLGSRQLLGDKKEGWIRKLRCQTFVEHLAASGNGAGGSARDAGLSSLNWSCSPARSCGPADLREDMSEIWLSMVINRSDCSQHDA